MPTVDPNDVGVDICNGPIGGHGFRKGYWNVIYKGDTYRIYSCVSHRAELGDQKREVQVSAARKIGWLLEAKNSRAGF